MHQVISIVGIPSLCQQYRIRQTDDLRVRLRVRAAKALDAELVVLAQTSCLRLFITEVRRDIVALYGQRAGNRAAFDERAHHDAVPSGRSVMERPPLSSNVYISFCTTSVVSPTPRTKSSVCSNVGKRISRKCKRRGDAAERFLKIVPFVRFRRQHVVRTLRRFDDFCHNRYLLSKETGQIILPFLLFLGFTTSRQLRYPLSKTKDQKLSRRDVRSDRDIV